MKDRIAITVMLLVLMSAGCTTDEEDLAPFDVQLKWFHQGQFAGIYMADHDGIYHSKGLDVHIHALKEGMDPLEELVSKNADAAIISADELVIAREQGHPLVAVAVVFKRSPVALFALEESGIRSADDLAGSIIGLERSENVRFMVKGALRNMGHDLSSFEFVDIGYDASALLAGDVDVSTGYVSNEPFEVIQAGKNVTVWLAADYGYSTYADVIAVREGSLVDDFSDIRAFTRATMQGWNLVLQNVSRAVDVTAELSGNPPAEERYQIKKLIPLMFRPDRPIGVMSESSWQLLIDEMHAAGLIDKKIEAKRCFTNELMVI